MTEKKSPAKKQQTVEVVNYNVHEDITPLLVSLDRLIPLDKNPRKGDVDAIAASYSEFGQVKPIVIRPNDDGTATVVAGNHQTEAARRLGWTHIAAISMQVDDKRALAFALAENRTMELGHTDPVLLHDAIITVIDEFPETFDALGWDNFQLAAMDEQVAYLNEADSTPSGFIPPVMTSYPEDSSAPTTESIKNGSSGGGDAVPIEAPSTMNTHEAVTRGASSVGAAGATAIVQYMLVFDDAAQQRKWYDFLRWLRSDPGTDGETTAERLLHFLDSHANYR